MLYFLDNGQTKPTPKEPKKDYKPPSEKLCLFRANCGSTKISTVVSHPFFIYAFLTELKLSFNNYSVQLF